MVWYGVGLFHTCEYLGQGISEISQRGGVKADLRGLSRTVEGPKPDASRDAVDDRLCDLYAAFSVLGGDGEREVDDVGLDFLDSHGATLSYMCALVGARFRLEGWRNCFPSLSLYIIPLF